MSTPDNDHDRLSRAYLNFITWTGQALDELQHETGPKLEKAIDQAKDKIEDWSEITAEEAEHFSDYLARDLRHAAEYIEEGERGLIDWLRLDLMYIEDKALETFSNMVDHTRLELDKLAENAELYGEWHTGEFISMGCLICQECGEEIQFKSPSPIPVCPKCEGTIFTRHENESN